MRAKFVSILVGLGLLAASAAPSLACAFHDQQASAVQQQTADAAQGGSTTAQ